MRDEDLVDVVRRAATEILDDPERAVAAWLTERKRRPRLAALPDHAPSDGTGGSVIVEIVAIVQHAWACAEHVLAQNGPSLLGGVLGRVVSESCMALVKKGVGHLSKKDSPPVTFSLSEEEAARIVPVVVSAVTAALHARETRVDPPRSSAP